MVHCIKAHQFAMFIVVLENYAHYEYRLFHFYFFNIDILVTTYVIDLKFNVSVHKVLFKRSMSQI